MLLQLLSGLAGSEAAAFRRLIVGLVLCLFAAVLLVLVLTFALFALYLWLSGLMEPWQAAAVISGTLLVLSLFVWLAGRLKISRRRKRLDFLQDEQSAFMRTAWAGASRKQKLAVIATAAIVGLIVGRGTSK